MEQDQNISPKEDAFPTVAASEKSSLSMFVGVGAFIIILVGLGWYLSQGTSANTPAVSVIPPPTPSITPLTQSATSSQDAAAAALSAQGSSDAPADINADLKATDLNSLNDIDKI